MPYELFDRSKLNILPLGERIHDIDLEKVMIKPGDSIPAFDNPVPRGFERPKYPRVCHARIWAEITEC